MAAWKTTIDLSFLKPLIETDHVTKKQAKEAGKRVAKAIRDQAEGMPSTVQKHFADQFELVRTVKRFDTVMNSFYDYCDANRIWVKTIL